MGCIKMTEKLSSYNNIVILTGAGVSVASGLKTYRGVNTGLKALLFAEF